ncbi:MAG: FAD-dependent oxidoreductase [Candidatus Niyogibacteria bacterium]|nr:FAD-dependent oxidoreductase [Candidatus Niyogibacteria bacterium]
MDIDYDLIIIGGGPAGAAAAVYASRKKIKTLLLTDTFGGQSVVSHKIQNWIGEKNISGVELAKKLNDHVAAQETVEIKSGRRVKQIKKNDGNFAVETEEGDIYKTKAIILASGSYPRKLGVSGEEKFSGKGVAYCSTCDAPLFKNKITAVIGGGNAGLEAVADLLPYAEKIYLLIRSEKIKGDPVTLEQIKSSSKVEIIFNAETKEIFGDKFVSGLKYVDLKSGEEKKLQLGGIFVEIGSKPNSKIAEGLVEINEWGEVMIDHRTGITSQPGFFAAGDVTDVKYKQNNISAGDAVKAALSAYEYLMAGQNKIK